MESSRMRFAPVTVRLRQFSGSEKANIITKIVGCVVALVGAILIFA